MWYMMFGKQFHNSDLPRYGFSESLQKINIHWQMRRF